ncbi:MAG TPA: hypothetical protein VI072_30070 [Polyangiaceae bacterium]
MKWLLASRTLEIFREDPLLLGLFCLLWCSAAAPLWVTPFLPLVDLGSNIGATGLLVEAALRQGVVGEYYFMNVAIVPYWTTYVLMALLEQSLGAMLAAKIIVAGALLIIPFSMTRLLAALGRDPRLGLLGFVFSWDTNLYWGWISFQYGMALALYILARLYEAQSLRSALRIVPLTLLLAVTHVHAVVLTLCAGGLMALVKRPVLRGIVTHGVGLSGCLLGIVPWLFKRYSGSEPLGATAFEWHSADDKLSKLFEFSLDNQPDARDFAFAAFVLLLATPLIARALPPRVHHWRPTLAALAILLAAAGLYFGLPFAMWGPISHWWTYPRYATYVLIGLLLLAPADVRRRRLWAIAPALLSILAVHSAVFRQFESYGAYVAPYAEIIESMPRGVRFLPLDCNDHRFRGTRHAALGQLHGYVAAVKDSYDPHLFDEPNNPLRYRARRMLPVPNWFQQLQSFTFEEHGRYYDYIIVHPTELDPFARRDAWRKEVNLVKQAGPWRLYKVKNPVAPGM